MAPYWRLFKKPDSTTTQKHLWTCHSNKAQVGVTANSFLSTDIRLTKNTINFQDNDGIFCQSNICLQKNICCRGYTSTVHVRLVGCEKSAGGLFFELA